MTRRTRLRRRAARALRWLAGKLDDQRRPIPGHPSTFRRLSAVPDPLGAADARPLWHTYDECGGRCPEHAMGF